MAKDILGLTVTDTVTEFRGVAVGHVRYLTGCRQALVAPKCDGNTFREPQWFDVRRLVVDASVPRVEIIAEALAASSQSTARGNWRHA